MTMSDVCWRLIISALFLLFLSISQCHALCLHGSNPNLPVQPDRETQSRSRREVLSDSSVAALLVASGIFRNPDNAAAATSPLITTSPIAILGANGRTGALCVAACLERGLSVKALTRGGTWTPPSTVSSASSFLQLGDELSNLLTVAACDVKDPSAIAQAVQGCRAVVYAASASKQGGDAKAIDNEGVVATAKACLNANIGRFILISSTATTRPKSLGYIFTNVLGGIMDQKRKGEAAVEAMYEQSSSSSSYIIIRPGGLEEPKENRVLGPSTLEISQGDTLAGIISRADLAEVCVELATASSAGSSNLRNTAMEVYYKDSVQPCEGRFKFLLKNGEAVRLHGSTYEELFQGIQPSIDFADI